MAFSSRPVSRRTSVDEVFDYLHEEILSLRLRPGDKISEAEIAALFDLSRQPVRDAFSKLENIGLLKIRPQRATEVKRFSLQEIKKSRFIRSAIETEVVRRAASWCDDAGYELLQNCMSLQREASDSDNYEAFNALDYEFHKLLCDIAQVSYAFDVIASEKAKVDRLCMLSMSQERNMPQLVEDHEAIALAIKASDAESAVAVSTLHLSRLDKTIASIVQNQADYFEPHDDGY